MATLETALTELRNRQTELAGNLTVMGQETATNETLKAQIPKVLRIFEDENEVLELRLKGINVRDALILTINVPTAQVNVANEIPIMFIAEAGIIDWGDGTIETVAAIVTPTHTYAAVGNYTVKFHHADAGSISIWSTETTAVGWGNYVTSIAQWPTNLYAVRCQGFRRLVSIPNASLPVASSHPTILQYLFASCVQLTSVPESLYNLYTELVNTGYAFYACYALSAVPEKLFYYNTKLNTVNTIFENARLTSISEDLFINQTLATNANYTLAGNRMSHIPKGLLRNTIVTTMTRFTVSSTYLAASELQIPLTVTNVQNMYGGCTALKTVHIRLTNVTTTHGTTYGHMFAGCTSLENVIVEGTIKASISFADSPLTYESFKNISNALVDLTGQTSQSLTISAATYALLNAADISEVTNKNWPLLIA